MQILMNVFWKLLTAMIMKNASTQSHSIIAPVEKDMQEMEHSVKVLFHKLY